MENKIYDEVKNTVKYWWIPLVIGISSIVLGIWCLSTPITTFLALTLLFIIGFFIKGVFEIGFALYNRAYKGWGWTLAIGIMDVLLGVVLIANTEIAPVILAYYIIFWLIMQSFWGIGISLDLSDYKGSGWGWLLALAVIGLLFSISLLFNPIVAGFIVSFLFSVAFIVYGIFRIYLSIKLRSVHKYMD